MRSSVMRHVGRSVVAALQRSATACLPPLCSDMPARPCRLSRIRRGSPKSQMLHHDRLRCSAAQQEASVSLYEDPALYDRVFSTREFDAEAGFLVETFLTHSGSRQPETFLELGCGPAAHALQLAARGLTGCAVDSAPAMVEYAREAARNAGATGVESVLGDIRRLEDHVPAAQADIVFLLCGTVSHLLTNADAAACFAGVAAALRPGGVFVLEMLHPEDLFGGGVEVGDVWEVDDPERGQLLVNYGADDGSDVFDPLSQIIARSVTVTAAADGGKPAVISRDTVQQRLFTSQEIELLGQAAGLAVVAQHGALTLPPKSVTDEDSFALVVVLQKT